MGASGGTFCWESLVFNCAFMSITWGQPNLALCVTLSYRSQSSLSRRHVEAVMLLQALSRHGASFAFLPSCGTGD